MTGNATQCLGADVPFADVPVTIDAGVVNGPRVVEMNGADILHFHRLLHALNESVESVFFANVVACCERVRRVETNAERDLRAQLHDQREMFEAVTDTVALSGSVFQQDAKRAELQPFARDLQTFRAERNAIGFAGATRTSGMHDRS